MFNVHNIDTFEKKFKKHGRFLLSSRYLTSFKGGATLFCN